MKLVASRVELVAVAAKNGYTFPVEVTINSLLFQQRRYFVFVVRDITQQERSHQEKDK
jgi:PAS domain S-box-containing protein